MATIDPRRLLRAIRAVNLTTAVCALVIVGAVSATPALASQSEERQGATLLRDFEAGKQTCGSLSSSQFELIGEYVMGRMMGSTAAHESMNQAMTSMIGTRGEEQAHIFMGQRFTGCARGTGPASFGTMMGMMGAGMMGGAYGSGGSRGGRMGDSGGGMMGGFGSRSQAEDADGWSGADTVMVVLMGLLLAGVIGGLVAWRPWRRHAVGTPLEILQARYARGDLDSEEYERRRQALGGLS